MQNFPIRKFPKISQIYNSENYENSNNLQSNNFQCPSNLNEYKNKIKIQKQRRKPNSSTFVISMFEISKYRSLYVYLVIPNFNPRTISACLIICRPCFVCSFDISFFCSINNADKQWESTVGKRVSRKL